MHFEIDRHWDADGPLHRLDGRLRIVAVAVWAAGLLWVRSPPAVAAGLACSLALAAAARIPRREIAFRLGAAAVILAPLLVVFPAVAPAGARLGELGAAATILLRGCALMLLAFPLFNTARFHVTMASFRRLGAPASLVSVLLLSYRALFIFLEDRRRMELSARTRGWRAGGLRRQAALTASHVGSLLVRSLDRTERLWQAMRTRAYTGEFPLARRGRAGAYDWAAFAAISSIPVLLVAGEYLLS